MPHNPILVESDRSSSASVRILLADGFARWRSHLRSFIERKTEWEIVFEACDGLEAVQKAAQLRPDVVLLGLALAGLNGIEATMRICQLCPNSKIVILTSTADEDLRIASLEAGASDYVLKSELTTALIPAVQAALRANR